MANTKIVFAAALSLLLLAACGSTEATTADNNAADAEANALENASPSDPGQVNASDEPGAEPVPPPDAVSHPNGFLPYGEDVPAPTTSEPTTADPPGSREPPPATEDEYIRNRQAGS